MKIMETSFKRSGAHTARLSVPDPAAGHCGLTPPLEIPGHSWASLGQSLVESLLLSPGSWCTQSFVCALQKSIFPVPCKFWLLYGGVNGNFLQEGLCHIQDWCTQSPYGSPLLTCTSTGDIQHSKAGLAQSLWGLLVHTGFVWAFWVCLGGLGFGSKCNFTLSTILLGLLLCPWMWGIFFGWDPTFFCRW